MKKNILIFLMFLITFIAFSQDDELPAFIIEVNTGFAIGIDLEDAYQLDVRLYYPIFNFGVVIEAGNLIIDDVNFFHFFVAPMYFIVNTPKWRVPVAIGFDLMGSDNNTFIGAGGIISAHYSFTKNIYAGINFGFTYAFKNIYDEITGYKTVAYTYMENGIPQLGSKEEPIIERKNDFGNYFYLKPSIVIGFQF